MVLDEFVISINRHLRAVGKRDKSSYLIVFVFNVCDWCAVVFTITNLFYIFGLHRYLRDCYIVIFVVEIVSYELFVKRIFVLLCGEINISSVVTMDFYVFAVRERSATIFRDVVVAMPFERAFQCVLACAF